MEPWFRTTLNYDRHRLDEVQAIIDGREFSSDNEEWMATKAMEARSLASPDILRTNLEMGMLIRRADEVAADSAIKDILAESGQGDEAAPIAPSRSEFLAAIS
jgi:hypothetical protein